MRQKRLLFCIGVAAVVCSGGFQSMCATTPVQRAAGTNGGQVKTLVRRWIEEGFNRRDLSVVDELFASEVIVNGQRVSRAAVKQSMNRFITAFPDLHVTITDIVAEGDKVAIWYSVQGTQTGDFEGIRATRKQARWSGADLFRIEKGKIAECRFVDDSLGLLRQLGATLSPPRGQ
jgi:steroid delta-isomerase-like uncharacterized protein